MMRLRPYKKCDAKTIVTWCKDEISFRKWSSDRWDSFPLTEADMNKKYVDHNGDCIEEDNFFPMTAFDESGIVGHLIMRFTDDNKNELRFGFKDVQLKEYEYYHVMGENWKCLELEMENDM